MRVFDPPYDTSAGWTTMPRINLYLTLLSNTNAANIIQTINFAKIVDFKLGNHEAYITVQHNAELETWLSTTSFAQSKRWAIYHTLNDDVAWYSPSYFLNGKYEVIDNRNIKLYGDSLPILTSHTTPYSNAADVPFTTIFDALLASAQIKFVTTNFVSQQEWYTWDFEKAGTFESSDLRNLQQILAKKYLVNIFSRSYNGISTQLLLKNRYETIPSSSTDYSGNATFLAVEEQQHLSLSHIDETDTVTIIDTVAKKHFLGFIPSTADTTEIVQSSNIYPPAINITNCFDPRFENGDLVRIDLPSNHPSLSSNKPAWLEVVETYNDKGLRTEIRSVNMADGVSGSGSYKTSNPTTGMKARIETDQFNGILSSTDNNLQAAMDTLDDHDHSGLATTEGIQDIIGAMVSSNTETGIAVTYDDTNGKLDFDAQTAGDARYAPIAKGVTNGDSHNHMGGDGAEISIEIPLLAHGNSATIAASTTNYSAPAFTALSATSIAAFITTAGTGKNFYLRTASAQPASGTLVCTVTINGVDSAITFTVAAGAAAGTYSDTTHSASISAGDRIGFKLVNNATGVSAHIGALALGLKITNS